ncbi:unc50 RNA binding protein [Dermatophagoides pteronyssinus]|uniref:Protein unc-50 n=2 Tax=Dermatophagoides pteronyssinus TaxID=6956 RepID=A0ABQ8J760_DERPT|nr:protein unc-50 homolog [Dermatophagoides pteronyssinus]KAH9418408.1 Protein unc-50 [Dermatophagoides pteronyssinus]
MNRTDSRVVILPESSSWQRSDNYISSGERYNFGNAFKKCSRYFHRLFRMNHMDFEFAFWQMVYLFSNPKKVYRNFQYRKQTKNQFARDDPAFLVLLSIWFIISASGLSLVLHLHFVGFIKFLLWVVLVDCILIGMIVASIFWFLTNFFLKKSNQDVEWGYTFDVHLNAFFPPLLILHVFQLFFYNVFINSDSFLARLFGNTLFMIAVTYYCYITFLGYSSLSFLKHTERILYPLIPLFLFYFMATLAGYNICRNIMDFYHYRVY